MAGHRKTARDLGLTTREYDCLRWTADGLFSIYFYHGPKRQLPPAELAKYDVVLTTYATLEYDYRAAQAGSMVACAYCSKKFKSDQKLAFHNRWFCGPNAKRSAAQSKTDSKKKKKTATRAAADDDSDSDDESEDDDDESEEESESEENEEEEALMGVSEEETSEEEEEEDDDDDDDELDSDDDEAGLLRAMKAQKEKLEYARLRNRAEHSDDEDEDDEDDEEKIGVQGKKKQDFYGDEEIDHEDVEDEEDRKDEEAAARAAQKQRARKMRLEDFGLEDEEDDSEDEEASPSSSEGEEDDEENSEDMTLQQKAQRSKLGAKNEDGKKMKKKTKKSDGISGGVVVEALDDDEKRAKREQLENASANADEAEEVRALVEELQKMLAEVETNVEPLVKSAKRGEYLTEEGISYLDTKYILLLSYCLNLVFYLLMKAEGKSIKDHPVVMRLVEIRSYIDKLRPIDKKLQYQVWFPEIVMFVYFLVFSFVFICARSCARMLSR